MVYALYGNDNGNVPLLLIYFERGFQYVRNYTLPRC